MALHLYFVLSTYTPITFQPNMVAKTGKHEILAHQKLCVLCALAFPALRQTTYHALS